MKKSRNLCQVAAILLNYILTELDNCLDFMQMYFEHLKTKEMKFELGTYYDLSLWYMKALKHLLQSIFILL